MRAARLGSSTIERICWDEGKLDIRFRATGRYVYHDVPEAVYESLRDAPSAGRYFNERIRGRYRCEYDPDRRRYGPRAA